MTINNTHQPRTMRTACGWRLVAGGPHCRASAGWPLLTPAILFPSLLVATDMIFLFFANPYTILSSLTTKFTVLKQKRHWVLITIHGCNHLQAAKQKQKIFLDDWKLASCIIWPPQVSDEKWTPAPASGRSAAAGGPKPGLANNSAGGAVRYLPGYLHSLWRTANYCFIAGWEFAGEGRIAWARCCGCQHTTQG